jgi:hypothetical protein
LVGKAAVTSALAVAAFVPAASQAATPHASAPAASARGAQQHIEGRITAVHGGVYDVRDARGVVTHVRVGSAGFAYGFRPRVGLAVSAYGWGGPYFTASWFGPFGGYYGPSYAVGYGGGCYRWRPYYCGYGGYYGPGFAVGVGYYGGWRGYGWRPGYYGGWRPGYYGGWRGGYYGCWRGGYGGWRGGYVARGGYAARGGYGGARGGYAAPRGGFRGR